MNINMIGESIVTAISEKRVSAYTTAWSCRNVNTIVAARLRRPLLDRINLVTIRQCIYREVLARHP